MEALSAEEIQALLAETDGPVEAAAAATAATGARLLLVVRRDSAAELLRARFSALGARVSVVRNPFQALDRIRQEPPQAIVTELGLWANDGELLFHRLAAAQSEAPVLLVAPSTPTPDRIVEQLTRAGAWGVIFEPISPQDAGMAVERLLETVQAGTSFAANDGDANPPPVQPVASAEAIAVPTAKSTTPCWGPAEELVALRVHLAISRCQRLALPAAGRAAEILQGIRQVAVVSSLAMVYEEKGRRGALLDAPGDPELCRLSRFLAGDPGEQRDLLDGLVLGESEEACLVLVGLAPRVRQALQALGAEISTSLAVALPSGR